MTKKDYILLAQALKDSRPTLKQLQIVEAWQGENTFINDSAFQTSMTQWQSCVLKIAAELENDNHRFTRERFLQACGYNNN